MHEGMRNIKTRTTVRSSHCRPIVIIVNFELALHGAILKRPVERIKTLQRSGLATSFFVAVLFLTSHAGATSLAGWTQYGEHGAIGARLVTDESACPALIADGKSLPMTERAPPSQAFPVLVCVAAIPAGAKHISAGGLDLPVPIAKPRRIVLFGDTGCRLKGAIVQNCNDESL
jgi:hypothetical protein